MIQSTTKTVDVNYGKASDIDCSARSMPESIYYFPVGNPTEPLIQTLRILRRANFFWSRHYDSELFHQKQIECAVYFYGLVPYITILEPLVRVSYIYNRNPSSINKNLLINIYVTIYSALESLRQYSEYNYNELTEVSIRRSLRSNCCIPLPANIVYWYLRVYTFMTSKERHTSSEICMYYGSLNTNDHVQTIPNGTGSNVTKTLPKNDSEGDCENVQQTAGFTHSQSANIPKVLPITSKEGEFAQCADYLMDSTYHLEDNKTSNNVTFPIMEHFDGSTVPRNPPGNERLMVHNSDEDNVANIGESIDTRYAVLVFIFKRNDNRSKVHNSPRHLSYRRGTSEAAAEKRSVISTF
ncbi:hypothetical protein BEWA_025070 [Theileria equi strain WA]|uniref:Uncharacterized protein n=1 Tax=Theileria equi strain WA TaxID=1537102 RepID=L0AWM3_THEEQ|nr:hypothetical protein BEWA_025070 [Theileria equi strain WA]AFZ79658.1 hypothetical protein BEWA_025070 [Theileria equi strain WA]|eukprot:XP_004829324.1 hypothetical protein BEWA_025070 [Theileria equi strain WA]